ncbi:LicD family protein [Ligilactobacillus acidipiscis]|uniref:LicD family protein n=1 Tax=Ligilactobacillus acidipiscis TaxID=89059 RepID=UPI002FDB63E3
MKVDLDDRKILQNAEKSLIIKFSKFCEENDLNYFLMGGSLLGAVRHQGFIPWDDDIDVGMPRPDYEKLQKLMSQQQNKIDDFPFTTFKNSTTTEYVARLENPQVKIVDRSASIAEQRNSWMDIFPLDGMPRSPFFRKVHGYNLLRLRLMLKYSEFDRVSVNMTERPWIEKVFIKLGKIVKPEKHLDTKKCLADLDRALQRFPYQRANYVVNFMGAYKLNEMFPKKVYQGFNLYDFENLKLRGTKFYDEVLTQMYGENYMEPPSAQIKNKHFTEVVKSNEK